MSARRSFSAPRSPSAPPRSLPAPLESILPHLVALWRERFAPGRPIRARPSRAESGLFGAELFEAASAIKELSCGFTRDRTLAGARYMDDPRLLGGYLLFYWPVSFAQTWAALRSAGLGRAATLSRRTLDLGAGPGSSSIALRLFGCKEVTAVDRSEAALALAVEIARRLHAPLRTRIVDLEAGARLPEGPFELITAVHTMNEMWHGRPDGIEKRRRLVESLEELLAFDGAILLVDPALTKTANEAIELRDALVAGGWTVQGPCTRQGRCPALPLGTCHAEVPWAPPAPLVRLAHAARIGRENLTFTYFLFTPPKAGAGCQARPWEDAPLEPSPEGLYRVVSERFLAKSRRLRVLVCGRAGRFPLSVDSRASFRAARTLRSMRRYDLVRIEAAEVRETGLGLTETTTLEVVEQTPSV